MTEESRIKKTIRNTKYNLFFKLTDVFLAFALRTIFIKTLGIAYLGVQGLFSNILTVLSLFESGVGTAIIFSLYEPLAKRNYKKVASLMYVYKKTYNFFGVAIIVLGGLLTPFLKYIINLPSEIGDIYIIYWLTIISTSITYFLSYRRSLLIADQRSDINTKNQIIFRITRFIFLAVVLISTRNFVLYLIVEILNSFLSNIHITHIIKKQYNHIEKEEIIPLEQEEKNTLLKYISAGMFSKVGQTVVTSTDSIIISIFISTISVGLYANYNLIYANLDIFIYLLFSSLTAAVGNFAVEKNKNEAKKLFDKLYFINYIITGTISVCMLCLATPFVQIWIGKEYVLDDNTVYIIVLNFYITSMCNAIGNFLSAQGYLSYKNRYRPLVEAIMNLLFSILFVAVFDFGLTGVFMGTTICFVFGRMWMDPFILYKYWFESTFCEFIGKYIKNFLLIIIMTILCKITTTIVFNILGVDILGWIICGILCISICSAIIFFVYKKSDEYWYFKNLIKKVLLRKI